MNATCRLLSLSAALAITAACDGGTPVPTTPAGPSSFLSGTWTGTLTIEREGEPTSSGSTTWTFEVVPGTNVQTLHLQASFSLIAAK